MVCPFLKEKRPGSSTLASWIRHCKRAGLYEQGRLLYEKGGLEPDTLSEEVMVDVEEDYQVCCRMISRGDGKKEKKKKTKEIQTELLPENVIVYFFHLL